ncbi:MAG: hypothetical protein IJ751_08490 [Oscillospiraceae bacterium]|nr:hypothetical protein [Oscillospiraceae bacterium]
MEMRLIRLLRTISAEDDFVHGVLIDLVTEEDQRTVADFIEYGQDVTYEGVILMALELGTRQRGKQNQT